MSRTYRIAHFGTGDTGRVGLRQIIQRPGLELAALLVHSPGKAGKDAGELIGMPPVGVKAFTGFDELLKLDVDCVSYFATDYGRPHSEVIDQMAAILASGKNIVTTSYTPLTYPPSIPQNFREQLEAACAKGKTALFCTGIVPGFTPDVMPLMAASLCHGVTSISLSERVPTPNYADPHTFAYLGYGLTPDEFAALDRSATGGGGFECAARMIADAMGFTLDEVRGKRAVSYASRELKVAAGLIRKGTVCTVAMTTEGVVDGEVVISLTMIIPMTEDQDDPFEPKFPEGSTAQRLSRVTIKAEPEVTMDLALGGGPLPGTHATAARAINAIDFICNAKPGLYSGLDIPMPVHGAMKDF